MCTGNILFTVTSCPFSGHTQQNRQVSTMMQKLYLLRKKLSTPSTNKRPHMIPLTLPRHLLPRCGVSRLLDARTDRAVISGGRQRRRAVGAGDSRRPSRGGGRSVPGPTPVGRVGAESARRPLAPRCLRQIMAAGISGAVAAPCYRCLCHRRRPVALATAAAARVHARRAGRAAAPPPPPPPPGFHLRSHYPLINGGD